MYKYSFNVYCSVIFHTTTITLSTSYFCIFNNEIFSQSTISCYFDCHFRVSCVCRTILAEFLETKQRLQIILSVCSVLILRLARSVFRSSEQVFCVFFQIWASLSQQQRVTWDFFYVLLIFLFLIFGDIENEINRRDRPLINSEDE